MPYCTIEEAWGNMKLTSESIDKKIKNDRHTPQMQEEEMPQIIVPENSYDFQNMYNHVEYPAINYEKQVLSVYPEKEPEQPQHVSFNRVPNVSRSMMKPLPEHNPSKNLIKQNNKRHLIDNDELSDTEFDSDSDEDNFKQKQNSQMLRYIRKLEKQNKRLRKLLNSYNNNNSMKTNVFDLMLYVISGIFIIFVLDSFIKLIRKKA